MKPTLENVVDVVRNIALAKSVKANQVMSKDVNSALAGLGFEAAEPAMIGQAKTYVAGNPLPQDTRKTLDSPLVALFRAKSFDFPPCQRWDVGLYNKIEQGILRDWYLQEAMLKRLMTVLCFTEVQQLLPTSLANQITVRQFLKAGQDGQLKIINQLWDECTEKGSYDDYQKSMKDNENEVKLGGSEQLPASVHPVKSVGSAVKELKNGVRGKLFEQLGVGFRVEGSGNADRIKWHIQRVTTGGMRAQVTIDDLMMANGYYVNGTTVATDTLAPRLNKTQKDLWNESGVCVSRSLLGATAFPYRQTTGPVILWAVNCFGMSGFDTEAYQLANKGRANGPWRPGEKCFGRFKPERVLGWVIVEKKGSEAGHGEKDVGWKFEIPKDARWTLTGGGTKEQLDFIKGELAAWAGADATIRTEYDFVSSL